jgi:hypothetical protein
MKDELLLSVIQELDTQLGNIKHENSYVDCVESLLKLRNNLITKHKPNPDLDWTIQNKKAIDTINFFNWTVIYKK